MHEFDKFAAFVRGAKFGILDPATAQQLKVRVLAALGAGIAAATTYDPVQPATASTRGASGFAGGTVIGGVSTTPERAAFYNTALSACLDYTDSYVAWAGGCRPADCIAAVTAAAEHVDAPGEDLLAALALAYQTQVRLCEVKPVPHVEYDSCTALAYAVTAAAAKVMRLTPSAIVQAIAATGARGALVPPAPPISPISAETLAAAEAAARGVGAALRGKLCIAAPAGARLPYWIGPESGMDWSREPLDGVLHTAVKRHMAGIRFQAAIDAAITIGKQSEFRPDAVRRVDVVAFRAGDLGVATEAGDDPLSYVHTKSQAGKSLPYAVAVALIDGEVQAAQYTAESIARPDVQRLLRKVRVAVPLRGVSGPFDDAPTQVTVSMYDGTVFCVSAPAAQGLWPRQMGWDAARARFERVVGQAASPRLAAEIIDCVGHLERRTVRDLTKLLAGVALTRSTSVRAPAQGCVV